MRIIKTKDELIELLNAGKIGRGTFSTGMFGLEQNKPVVVVGIGDTADEILKAVENTIKKTGE